MILSIWLVREGQRLPLVSSPLHGLSIIEAVENEGREGRSVVLPSLIKEIAFDNIYTDFLCFVIKAPKSGLRTSFSQNDTAEPLSKNKIQLYFINKNLLRGGL